jgi:hypothetical protein
MLVQLGDVWVDPTQVIFITCKGTEIAISIKEDGFIGAVPIARADTGAMALKLRDNFADIINNALQNQSYGNPGEESAVPAK